MRAWLVIFAGGAAGALARTGLAEALPVEAGRWPWATFVVNVLGCLVLGAVLVSTAPGSPRRGLLGPGFCGALTTFSTFQLELVELVRDDRLALATFSTWIAEAHERRSWLLLAGPGLGLGAAALGRMIGAAL